MKDTDDPVNAPRIFDNSLFTKKSLAKVFGCSPEFFDRIPHKELPRFMIGRRVHYIGREILQWVRTFRRHEPGTCDEELIRDIQKDVLPSVPDGVHRLPERRK